ncbi:MAG: hypothetical protein EA400_18285 [Chromatiaceae bacterium]|nr:MAG: hypothetical protein EA400_18285 [Chromatiaceae bacterium]
MNKAAAPDRAGLERLLRDGARPPFALVRLERFDATQVVYRLPACSQIGRDPGGTAITTTACAPPTHPGMRLPSPL